METLAGSLQTSRDRSLAGRPQPQAGEEGPPARSPAVLVHQGNARNALLIAADLARRGVRVELAADSPWAAARFSRYVRAFHRVPSLARHPEAFVEAVCRICRTRRLDLFLPSFHEVFLLAPFRDLLQEHTRYPFAGAELIRRVDDKMCIGEIARSAGLRVPRSERIAPERPILPPGFRFPVVYKPVVGAAARGFGIARDAAELLHGLRATGNSSGWLVQEFLPGRLMVWDGIYWRGRVRASFQFEAVRTRPATGGASVLRRSLRIPSLDEQAARLLEAAGYEGFCTLDFIEGPEPEQYWFIDFNPRFGSSLHAALSAGVSFPYLLLRLALGWPVEAPPYACGLESVSLEGHFRRILAWRPGGPSPLRLIGDLLQCGLKLRQAEELAAGALPFLLTPLCELVRRAKRA